MRLVDAFSTFMSSSLVSNPIVENVLFLRTSVHSQFTLYMYCSVCDDLKTLLFAYHSACAFPHGPGPSGGWVVLQYLTLWVLY